MIFLYRVGSVIQLLSHFHVSPTGRTTCTRCIVQTSINIKLSCSCTIDVSDIRAVIPSLFLRASVTRVSPTWRLDVRNQTRSNSYGQPRRYSRRFYKLPRENTKTNWHAGCRDTMAAAVLDKSPYPRRIFQANEPHRSRFDPSCTLFALFNNERCYLTAFSWKLPSCFTSPRDGPSTAFIQRVLSKISVFSAPSRYSFQTTSFLWFLLAWKWIRTRISWIFQGEEFIIRCCAKRIFKNLQRDKVKFQIGTFHEIWQIYRSMYFVQCSVYFIIACTLFRKSLFALHFSRRRVSLNFLAK